MIYNMQNYMEAKNKIKNILRRAGLHYRRVCCALGMAAVALLLTSCGDFFDQESDHVIYTDNARLSNPSDSIYSVTGIMTKLQALADRTILLGEVRGDLVNVTDVTSSDLRDVAHFNIGSDNKYNQPRDYYAVINNCNFYIAHADTAVRNNRNENLFMREYAAVKAYRAWTYLQLVINYGTVPFVTEPILTKAAADRDYPRKGIAEVFDWLIQDIKPLVGIDIPRYGMLGSVDSRFLYFPIHLLLGELNLWAGHYKEAALSYYNYITTANGANSVFPTGTNSVYWDRSSTTWNIFGDSGWSNAFFDEDYYSNRELITMIPGDSIPSSGNYSQLRNIFNTTGANEYRASLIPSEAMIELSAAQRYCQMTSDLDTVYAPQSLQGLLKGDLRLWRTWNTIENAVYKDKRVDYQEIQKYRTRNVHIYRRQMVYLRMAEALNCAGYPRFAYRILAGGVNDNVIANLVMPYYRADSLYLSQFRFPVSSNSGYIVSSPAYANTSYYNTIGIHDRGSGWSAYNQYYQLPYNPEITDSLAQIAYQQEGVEQMIANEGALEFAFEGTRYYDLLRFALRRGEPSFLANRIYGRRGDAKRGLVEAEIKSNLLDTRNWFLSWDGKIGFDVTDSK